MSGEQIKPGYKQTEVGVIPESWSVRSLGELCDYQNGTALEAHFNRRDGFKVISIGNYGVAGQFVETGNYIAFEKRKLIDKFILHANDLAMSLNDKTAVGAIIGRVLLIEDNDSYVFNQRTMRLRPKLFVSSSYLHHAINSDQVHASIVGLAKPGTQIYVNTDDVLNLRISTPDKGEQRAIATVLSEVDALLTKLDQLIAKKRDLKQATMQQLLTGQTRLPGFSGEWRPKRLGDVIAEISDGGTPPTSDASCFGGDIPWIVIEDIQKAIHKTKSSLTKRGLQKCASKLWPKGTLILSTGATIGEVGILEMESATKQGICGILFHEHFASPEFMYYWFMQHKCVLLNLAQGSSIKEVRAPTIVQLSATLPTPAEQIAIAGVLSTLDHEIESLEWRHKKTQSIKRGMMQELLTGRIRLV